MFTPHYTITLPDHSQVHFLWTRGAFKHLCKLWNIDLPEFQLKALKVSAPDHEGLKGVTPIQTTDLEDILLAGHFAWCTNNKQPFTATITDAENWVDSLGNMFSGTTAPIWTAFFAALYQVSPDKVTVEGTEKKSQEAPLRGESLT